MFTYIYKIIVILVLNLLKLYNGCQPIWECAELKTIGLVSSKTYQGFSLLSFQGC